VTISGQGCCARCGARLRRVRARGEAWCDPCRRAGPDPRRELPPGFYFQDHIAAALLRYDFGTVFREVRAHTGWSQQTLGSLVGLDQSRISAIERDVCRLRDVALVARVATTLRIPSILLGFGNFGATVGDARVAGRKVVSWVDRRDFVQHVATLTFGVTGAAGLDIDRLTALLPQAEPTGTRHIGTADVETIEQTTATLRRQDHAHGSGLVQAAAVAQVQSVLPLLDAQATSGVRSRLLVATADLAAQAGYMSFDVTQHEAARRLWMIALNIARHAEDPRDNDVTVYALYNMALQAVHLGRPDEALRLVHLGHAAVAGPHPVAATLSCCLANIQAKVHAARGDTTDCDRALGKALEYFAAIDPASRESWSVILLDEAGLSGYQGHIHYTLALTGHDPRAAQRAVPLLRHAVDHFRPDCARARAFYLADLVGAHALAGDADTAVTLGHQAIDSITALHSPRAYDRLRVLNTVLEPRHSSAGVAELRDRITATAA
jgi:hypothetical protein